MVQRYEPDKPLLLGSDIRIKFEPYAGIQDAVRRLDSLRAEGGVIPQSAFSRRCERIALIERRRARSCRIPDMQRMAT